MMVKLKPWPLGYCYWCRKPQRPPPIPHKCYDILGNYKRWVRRLRKQKVKAWKEVQYAKALLQEALEYVEQDACKSRERLFTKNRIIRARQVLNEVSRGWWGRQESRDEQTGN